VKRKEEQQRSDDEYNATEKDDGTEKAAPSDGNGEGDSDSDSDEEDGKGKHDGREQHDTAGCRRGRYKPVDNDGSNELSEPSGPGESEQRLRAGTSTLSRQIPFNCPGVRVTILTAHVHATIDSWQWAELRLCVCLSSYHPTACVQAVPASSQGHELQRLASPVSIANYDVPSTSPISTPAARLCPAVLGS
jgi:hypothetical protein